MTIKHCRPGCFYVAYFADGEYHVNPRRFESRLEAEIFQSRRERVTGRTHHVYKG